jgi:hypothetical protein
MKEETDNSLVWNPPFIEEKDTINDSYRKSRGGRAEMITIYCVSCSSPVIYYQKDGQGNLYRCYIDRIVYPYGYKDILHNKEISADQKQLKCRVCNTSIGTLIVYDKEQRYAYGLFRNKFYKRKDKKK